VPTVTVIALLLLGVDLAVGFAGAVVAAVVLVAVTSTVCLLLTAMPAGYPTPPSSWPRGEPQ
jgi:hypothetical protein